MNLNGELNVKQFSPPTASGSLELAPFNLRRVLKQLEKVEVLPALSLPDETLLPLKTAALKTQFNVYKANKVNLKNLQLSVDDNQLETPQMKFDLSQETLDSGAFSLQALGVHITGKINATQLLKKPTAKGKLTLAPFNPQKLLKRLNQAPLELPAPFKLTPAALQTRLSVTPENVVLRDLQITVDENKLNSEQVNFNWNKDTLTLDHFVLNVLGAKLKGNLSAKQFSTQPTLQASLELAKLNPRVVLKRLGHLPETTDPTALNSLALETELQGDFSQINLDKIKISLDNSQLHGNCHIKAFKKPIIAFNLTLDNIDIARYLSPQEENAKPLSGEDIVLPLGILSALNLNGTLKVGELKTDQMKIKDLQLDVETWEDQIKLTPKDSEL
ncbi:hypothetical protein QUF54_04360 [Candidatus Marithioploca araucensis]|uniref:AsmA family protein n=1 Tax=Candidatus Marithioploca araucensis TaxID=70273 RepID=A0ABT7VSC0_9GAMM|nr:hypothetical protein [Candidatus Marithioploca araucensis]